MGIAIGLALLVAVQADTTLAGRIDGFVQPYVDAGVWSGAVIVARGDSVVFTAGYGWADAEHRVPNGPETRFPVASVTKSFTRIATARLWRADVLRPEDTVSEFLPSFPRGDEITIEQLVRHRSGIPDTDALSWFAVGQRFPHDIQELVDSLGSAPLDFDPGSRYNYSNGGYTVLARVLELATRQPWGEVVRQSVFEPAGMTGSGDWGDGGLVMDRAEGYLPGLEGELVPGPSVHPSNKIGAGSAFTTVRDLHSFARAFSSNALLPPAAQDSLFGTSESAFGRPRFYWGGRGPSYTAGIQFYPDEGLLVAALGNNYSRLNEEITDGLTALVLGDWEDERISRILSRRLPFEEVPVPRSRLQEIAGSFRHPWGFGFRIEVSGDRAVYVDVEHQTRTPLVAVGDGTFVSPLQWAEIRFDEEGIIWEWLDFPGRRWQVERVAG